MATRKIRRLVRGNKAQDGAGVRLTRVVGSDDIHDFDPFLLLDVFDSTNPDDYLMGFPEHPHRGIETVTYLMEGEIEYRDNLGNRGVLQGGDCRWMTAGSGILHSEMPKNTPYFQGIQFWLNMPRRDKMTSPKHYGVTADRIPNITVDGGVVRVISGSYKGMKGAIESNHVQTTLLDVELLPGVAWRVETPHDMTAYLYVIEGSGKFSEADGIVIQKNAILFTEGDDIAVRAGGTGVRFVLCMATPLREPVVWGGPIVMNTEFEVEEAFHELRNDTFIKDENKEGGRLSKD